MCKNDLSELKTKGEMCLPLSYLSSFFVFRSPSVVPEVGLSGGGYPKINQTTPPHLNSYVDHKYASGFF